MKRTFEFDTIDSRAALVILFPAGVKGLFNPEIHKFVRDVESRLDGVHVTYALAAGSPDLNDAFAAARFAGSDSAVVVHAQDGAGLDEPADMRSGDRMMDWAPVDAALDASAVAATYRGIVSGSARAA